MDRPEDTAAKSARGASLADLSRASGDWSRLFGRPAAQDALEEIARTVDPRGLLDIFLDGPASAPRRVTARRARAADVLPVEHSVAVAGSPEWRVRARGSETDELVRDAAQRAGLALEAWRAAREEAERAEARLKARTLELDLLQDLGRAAAEARTFEGLCRGVCHALHRAGEDDALAVAHRMGPRAEVLTYLVRPLDGPAVQKLAQHARAVLGWQADEAIRLRIEHLDLFDGKRAPRADFDPADLIVLPLLRRGSAVASLAILPARPAREDRLRLLFGAANQMAVHLDRILTVREAEEGRFRAVLDSMPQAVFLLDSELRLLNSNPSALRLLEGSLAPGEGAVVGKIGTLDVQALRSQLIAGEERSSGQEARLDNGRVVDATLSAFEDSVHRRRGYVLVLADVTDRRRLHERLAQSEKLSSLGELISGIAHELNNPLASVIGYAQLVRSGTEDERLARRLELIDQEARRCRQIVHNLLSFARRHAPERRPFSLNETVHAVVALLAYQLRVSGIEARLELDAELPALHGDPHELKQAMLNLTANALQAIRSTGRGGWIAVRSRQLDAQRVWVEVEDSGPGVPDAIRSRVFDPFFTTKEPGQGTGLGLSIVYGIVASHGGSVEVETGAEGGALFRVLLPLGSSCGIAAPVAPERADDNPSPGRVLIVEDEEPLARLIEEALREDGHHAVAVLDRQSALERIARENFDLVICDLKMPGIALEELRREMERLRPGLSRQVLLVTGDILSAEPDELARREGLALLHKPFDLRDLRRVVRGQLARERGSCGT